MTDRDCGLVLWLMGLSGAGKTTLGRLLRGLFQKAGRPCYLLDGDEVRSFFDHDLKFSREERVANIKRIIWGAYLLSQNGVHTIVCNIAPFEELRQLARRKIPNYHQVYLRKEIQQCLEEDTKGIYRHHLGRSELVGVDLPFEEPAQSDLVIHVGQTSVTDSIELIRAYLRTHCPNQAP
jgi:adenylylsulfate kinase-like enzyme